MDSKSAIVARRSVRRYTGEPLRESLYDELAAFVAQVRPLHDDIPVDIELCSRKDFAADYARAMLYQAGDFVVLRSAGNAQGYLENIGFIGEQIVLWLTQRGVGTCWAGMAKPKNLPARGELPYVIAVQFGRADNEPFRRLPEEAPRKKLHEIVLGRIALPEYLPLLDAGRLAPSAVNLQPVRYLTDDEGIHICRVKPPVANAALDRMQRIDVGAAMANMFVECGGDCTWARRSTPPDVGKNYIYEYTMLLSQGK